MDQVIEKQLQKIARKERRLLQKSNDGVMKQLTGKVEDKIPPGLYEKLQQAFYLGFKVVFQKGSGIIEKTYDGDQLRLSHQVYDASFEQLNKKKGLKAINKLAGQGSLRNLGITALEGAGLGLLGIGLPDIPIFIGMVLKSIYEIALSYGFSYQSDDEKYFILKIIEAALASEETREDCNAGVDKLIGFYTDATPLGYDLDLQMRQTADCFAADMLCLKFLQGLPIVGVVGGPANVMYCKRISDYARLKYQKRYLLRKQQEKRKALEP